MSHDWSIPSNAEVVQEEPPTIWVPVVAFFAITIAGIILTILNWTPGKSIWVEEFFGWALCMPLLISGAFCGIWYLPYEDWQQGAEQITYRIRDRYARWRLWTQGRLALIASAVLTPEVDLAERMLGLDGKPPENAGETLVLPEGNPGDPGRIERILEKLLEPMLPQLKKLDGSEAVSVRLQSADPAQLETLHQVLKKLELRWVHPNNLKHVKAAREEAALIEEWIDLRSSYDYSGRYKRGFEAALVVALQLHEPQIDLDVQPTCTEAAAALLFTSFEVHNKYKFKMQTALFRPAVTDVSDLSDRMEALYAAAPVPMDKLRHAWMGGLPKLARHNINGVMQERAREAQQAKDGEKDEKRAALAMHDLDQALGLPGPASTWLMQALAAQMVTYGQGPQLVVAPAQSGVMLNLLAAQRSAVSLPKEPAINFYPASTALLLACLGVILIALMNVAKVSNGWKLTAFIVLIIFLLIGLPILGMLKRRAVNDDFWRRW
jgi:hypothetical protein